MADQFLQNNETASAVFFDTFLINFFDKKRVLGIFLLKNLRISKKSSNFARFFRANYMRVSAKRAKMFNF